LETIPSEQERGKWREATSQIDGDHAADPVEFERCDLYTTFEAEFRNTENDLVAHFFLPDEFQYIHTVDVNMETDEGRALRHKLEVYWLEQFPAALKAAGEKVFRDTRRMSAEMVVGVVPSWGSPTKPCLSYFFNARGYVHSVDPLAMLDRLFRELDKLLTPADQALRTTNV